jgi:hypothetical protein
MGANGAISQDQSGLDAEARSTEEAVLRLAGQSSSGDAESRKHLRGLRSLIRAGYRLATLQIECDDDGSGFSRAVVESGKLFEPFADLEVVAADGAGSAAGRDGAAGGGLAQDVAGTGGVGTASATRQSGLGLSIVRSIACEQMRGEVGLASRMLQGTAVWVRVPVWIRPHGAAADEGQNGAGVLDGLGEWVRFGSTTSEEEDVESFVAASGASSEHEPGGPPSHAQSDHQAAAQSRQELRVATAETTQDDADEVGDIAVKKDGTASSAEKGEARVVTPCDTPQEDLPIAHRKRLVSNCSGNRQSVEDRADTSQSDVTGAMEGFTPAAAAVVVGGADGHGVGLGDELRAESGNPTPADHRSNLRDRRPAGMGRLLARAMSSGVARASDSRRGEHPVLRVCLLLPWTASSCWVGSPLPVITPSRARIRRCIPAVSPKIAATMGMRPLPEQDTTALH